MTALVLLLGFGACVVLWLSYGLTQGEPREQLPPPRSPPREQLPESPPAHGAIYTFSDEDEVRQMAYDRILGRYHRPARRLTGDRTPPGADNDRRDPDDDVPYR